MATTRLPGTEFLVEEVSEAILLRPASSFKLTKVEDVIGCTDYAGPSKSLDEIERAIVRRSKERRASGRR